MGREAGPKASPKRLSRYLEAVAAVDEFRHYGVVTQVVGLTLVADGPRANLGELCYIDRADQEPLPAEVVGFSDKKLLLMPLGELDGIGPGNVVTAARTSLRIKVGPELLGRVIDGLGEPIDGKGAIHTCQWYPLQRQPPNPLTRQRIQSPLSVGVRAIDGLLTCGSGHTVGIFAGSRVGKSTLLGMMARNTTAEINVIANRRAGPGGKGVSGEGSGRRGPETLRCRSGYIQ